MIIQINVITNGEQDFGFWFVSPQIFCECFSFCNNSVGGCAVGTPKIIHHILDKRVYSKLVSSFC